jgi:hypothetical protein
MTPDETEYVSLPIDVYLHESKGHLYTATLASPDGEVVVTAEREPIFSSCRVLIQKGMAGVVLFYRPGKADPDFIVRDLETAAGLSVWEKADSGPIFAPYRQFATDEGRVRPVTANRANPAEASP